MAGVLDVNRRRRWAPGPQAKLDRSHPLAAGLVHCLIGSMGIDLANSIPTTVTGAPTFSATAYGPSRITTGGASVDTSSTSITGTSGNATMFIAGIVLSWPNSATPADKGNSGSSRDFNASFSSGGTLTYFQARGDQAASALTQTIALPTLTPFAWGLSLAGTNITQYLDGALNGSGTLAASGTGDTSPVTIGRNSSGSAANADANFSAVMFWSRGLSASEHVMLAVDPFAMLRTRG